MIIVVHGQFTLIALQIKKTRGRKSGKNQTGGTRAAYGIPFVLSKKLNCVFERMRVLTGRTLYEEEPAMEPKGNTKGTNRRKTETRRGSKIKERKGHFLWKLR